MTSVSARTAACLLWLAVACGALGAALATAGPQKANHELLTNLGLVRRRVPLAHHRKRLAAEMRSSGSHDDSHMVVIKLPPALHYYALSKPAKADASPNAVNKVPVYFHGNGKPTGVYHWNLPVIKKIKTGHGRHGGASKRTSDGDSKIYHIQKTSPFSEHTQHTQHIQHVPHMQRTQHVPQHVSQHASQHAQHSNDVLKAQESAAAPAHANKVQAPKSKISYYTPRRKTMFHKFFQGNGKPHSFYVIEKSKKPIHYHRLLPGTR